MIGGSRFAAVLSLVWLLVGLAGAPAHAQPQSAKIALLIGNQGYDRSVGELTNPHNDIAVVGDALRKQGFTVLPPVKDARRSTILGAVRDLVRQLNAAGTGAIGFLYYSGHGAAESDTGFNYLIPVDAKEPGSATFWDDSLKLDDVLKLLDGARGAAKFIVFDACRNELRVPAKSTTKGLLPVAEQQGMFIAYASAPGRTASDAGTTSGPYAAALAAELGKGGQDHLNLFQNVKEAVIAKTGGVQQPWFMDGLVRRIYPTGVPKAWETTLPPAASSPAAPAPDRGGLSEAGLAWERVHQTQSVAVLEAFAKQFPGTVYAAEAQERLKELRGAQAAAAQPAPKQPTPPAPAPSKQAAVVPPPAPQPAPSGRQQAPYSHWDCKSNDSWCRVGLEMRVLPTGSYLRGSSDAEIAALVKTYNSDWYKNEGPQRRVTIGDTLAIAKHETTFELWDLCVAEKGCKTSPKDEGWGRGKRPVIDVSWDDITNEFLPWLNRKLGIAPTAPDRYRLPSEAEWEYAARAGTTGDYSFPSPITAAKANYNATYTHAGSPKGTWRKRTVAVDDGGFPLNPWGLAHVHGNAWEWVQDCFVEGYGSAPIDGAPVESGSCSARVLRGGSWDSNPKVLRSADRIRYRPDFRYDDIGFRLARTLPPTP